MSRPSRAAAETSLFPLGLFLLALVPRLAVALYLAGEPVWDGHYYDFGARRIAAGLGYSDDRIVDGVAVWHPWCHYPVGFSAFLGLFYRVFGAVGSVGPAVNALVGAALAVVTWLLAERALTPSRAKLAGVLVALHPGLILYAGLLMTEPLAALLTLFAFWLATYDSRPHRGLVLGALALGVAALVRPQALLCAPFLPLVVAKGDGPLLRGLGRFVALAAFSCALALVPVLPWTVRNCRVMDGCALVSTNGGWNLAIGAFPRATGRFETLRSSDGCREVTGQVQQDRCWFSYGLDQIRANPWRWLALAPAKLSFTFDHESFPVEYLREARPGLWPEHRRVFVRDLLSSAHRLLVVFSAIACVSLGLRGKASPAQVAVALLVVGLVYAAYSRQTPLFWPLVVFASAVPWIPLRGRPPWPPALRLSVALLGTTALTHVVFFGEDRYHMVVAPVFCLLAAAALRPAERA